MSALAIEGMYTIATTLTIAVVDSWSRAEHAAFYALLALYGAVLVLAPRPAAGSAAARMYDLIGLIVTTALSLDVLGTLRAHMELHYAPTARLLLLLLVVAAAPAIAGAAEHLLRAESVVFAVALVFADAAYALVVPPGTRPDGPALSAAGVATLVVLALGVRQVQIAREHATVYVVRTFELVERIAARLIALVLAALIADAMPGTRTPDVLLAAAIAAVLVVVLPDRGPLAAPCNTLIVSSTLLAVSTFVRDTRPASVAVPALAIWTCASLAHAYAMRLAARHAAPAHALVALAALASLACTASAFALTTLIVRPLTRDPRPTSAERALVYAAVFVTAAAFYWYTH